ncbi:MAG: hypothetical protein R2792_11920 [Saprospiraceae bacterium]
MFTNTNFVRRFLVFIFSAFISVSAFAQMPTSFSENPNEFVDELEKFMTASKRPDLEEAFKVFEKRYKSGNLGESRIQSVIRLTNQLAAQRLSPYPYYLNYINAVSAAAADSDTTLFERWHLVAEQTVAGLGRGKAKPLGQFLLFSSDYMEKRAFKIGTGGSVTWYTKGGNTRFAYNSNAPQIICENVELIGTRKNDSLIVYNAYGTYYPMENTWIGTKGKVTWEAAGLDSTVYALLTKYEIESHKPLFSSDTVTFYYPLYFPKGPILGSFEHNVVVGGGNRFPKFESFDKNLKITKIGEGIEYIGGFRLSGSSLYGYGTNAEPAQVTMFNKKRERIFYGTGELFIIKREKSLVAEGVNAKLYMDSDSLFHPAVGLRVDIPKEIIQLSRGQKGSERNPFFSSFYNMNLDAESITWHLAQDSLAIGTSIGTEKGVATKVQFESSNRFDPKGYTRMQGIASKNPISTLYILHTEVGSRIVSDNHFAQRLNPNFDYSSIQTLLADMVSEGFINYYFDRHEIELRDKLIHYALASTGKKDFDAINIVSESKQANAHLDLKTKETTIFEVDKLELSDRQKVALKPSGRSLTLLQNRDMRFSGRLFAGFALFEGQDMHFTYDKFQVEFDSVKHLDFYLPTGTVDKNGQPIALAMNSTVEYVSGVLLVDAPNNKSGKDDLNIFPSLQSKKNSFVYYERSDIQAGAYKRDSFFFKLDPFSFNGLDSYTPVDLKFKGEMRSADIFPEFRETIVVRTEDKSFGFIHRTPKEGYPTYVGKGKYTGTVDLSNQGFLGEGTVEYLTADIKSEDIIFRPKQMTCTARSFFMEEDRASEVKVPQARGEDVKVNWLPYRDSMYVESRATDFELFKEPGYAHKGILILTPSGLKGRGLFDWDGGSLESKLIEYGPFQAFADTADLKIKALDSDDILFDSRNVDGELDFDVQTGHFKANTEDANTTLPLNKYRTSMNDFTWDMKAQTITFKSDENIKGNFVSIDPEQDTLNFKGETAFYDMKASQLIIGGVDQIKSADAFIYPDSGNVEILPGGKMQKLENAKIVADTVSKYHTINRATVEVLGKKLFNASGYYEYNIPGYEQEIFFDNIVGQRYGGGTQSTKKVHTTANGYIGDTTNFHMDAKTQFKGDVILTSDQLNLRFDGYAKLDADKLPSSQWFSMRSVVDKNNPFFKIANSKNEPGDPLVTGFYIDREFSVCYPRILLPAYSRRDRQLIDCQSMLKYDVQTDRYFMGDSSRVLENKPRGNLMVFDNRVGTVEATGEINIGEGLNYMSVTAAGKLKSDFNLEDSTSSYKVTGEIMAGLEITIPKPLMDVVVNDIMASSFGAPMASYTTEGAFYQQAILPFISDTSKDEETLNFLRTNIVNLPKPDNKYAFLLGKHNVMWNSEYQSFISTTDKFPLISVNGEPINKVLTIYTEYKMPSGGDDRYYLYIKVSPELWYFFGYQAGVLNVVSSSTRFNDTLLALKTKDTQIKMPDGELYEIVAANPSVANAFVSRIQEGRRQ